MAPRRWLICFILDPATGPGTTQTTSKKLGDRDAERVSEMFGLQGSGRDVAGTIAAARRVMEEGMQTDSPQGTPTGSRVANPRVSLPGLPLIGRKGGS